MILYSNGCLEEYYQRIEAGEITAGSELKMELKKLLEEMNEDRYI